MGKPWTKASFPLSGSSLLLSVSQVPKFSHALLRLVFFSLLMFVFALQSKFPSTNLELRLQTTQWTQCHYLVIQLEMSVFFYLLRCIIIILPHINVIRIIITIVIYYY